MSTSEPSPGPHGDRVATLTASTAWKVLWHRHLGRLFPFVCAAALVTAGIGLAYLTSFRRSYEAGYAVGVGIAIDQYRSARSLEWHSRGMAEAYQGLGFWLSKGTLDGLREGWCLLKLGEKPIYSYGSPVENISVMQRGKQYALNIDGTVWFRE